MVAVVHSVTFLVTYWEPVCVWKGGGGVSRGGFTANLGIYARKLQVTGFLWRDVGLGASEPASRGAAAASS